MATKVTLRKRPASGGKQSLYLDFYPPIIDTETGKPSRREALGQYVFENPKSPLDKQHNKETLLIAEQIRQRRENEINKPEVYSAYELEQLNAKERGNARLLPYVMSLAEKRNSGRYRTFKMSAHYIKEFFGEDVRFSDLTDKKCNDFKSYLQKVKPQRMNDNGRLSVNSVRVFFGILQTTLRQAYKDDLLQTDLNAKLSSVKPEDVKREFLTLDELNALIKADCPRPVVKNAALFSALTGLRYSDIFKLVWSEVQYDREHGYSIHFRQKKTGGLEYIPISKQAFQLLGERSGASEKVFEGLRDISTFERLHLARWLINAGISKPITFHCFRHTYATLQISAGTDIYTVSKMLGHRSLGTTQIYAKVVDEKKREATNRITLNF